MSRNNENLLENISSIGRRRTASGMSYKFQRLREKIRQAVASGELSGKLPGERELARRFNVNAKTLSKALTDLAAEGLLHRSIGRGTFVKGSEIQDDAAKQPWLLLVDKNSDPVLIQNLTALNAHVEVADELASIRPSFLSQFSAVIDLATDTPETFYRDLLIRGIPLVAVEQAPQTYSINSVLLDSTLGVAQLTRDLALAGHQHFLAVEDSRQRTVADAIRHTAPRYCSDWDVDVCAPHETDCAADYGSTAFICDSVATAEQTMRNLQRAGIAVPHRVSVAAVGWTGQHYPCTGYFVDPRQKAAAVADILQRGQPGRPTTLWLSGLFIDRGTTGPGPDNLTEGAPPKRSLSAVVA
jgi:DNA-binding transcriptional regulator YhcF (GntR family)